MCSAVFITGLDPEFAAKNIGGFTAPFEERDKLGKPVIDRAKQTVTVTAPSGVKRIARYLGSQGCVTLPIGGNCRVSSRARARGKGRLREERLREERLYVAQSTPLSPRALTGETLYDLCRPMFEPK